MRKQECPVVKEIVARHPFRDRSLRGSCFHRGVGVDRPGCRVKARVGDAINTDSSIVVTDVFDQPVHGVIRITAFVDVLRPFLVLNLGPDVYKRSFGHVAAADILGDCNIPVTSKPLCLRADKGRIHCFPVRRRTVGSSCHENRVILRRVLRCVDGGEKLHAVTHRDHILMFVIMIDDGKRLLRGKVQAENGKQHDR